MSGVNAGMENQTILTATVPKALICDYAVSTPYILNILSRLASFDSFSLTAVLSDIHWFIFRNLNEIMKVNDNLGKYKQTQHIENSLIV